MKLLLKWIVYLQCLQILLLTHIEAMTAKPYVVGRLGCELGNNLFQVAAISAHAWDNGAEVYFPDLVTNTENGMPANYAHIFFRCATKKPSKAARSYWTLPISSNFCYMPIPYKPNMVIEQGTFQSEKFFAHHRQRILALFAPHPDDLTYIQAKYADILMHPYTVGVQMRWWGRSHDLKWSQYLAQYGLDYFTQAVAHFPEDALFVVSSNNLAFAKANFPKNVKNVVFIQDEPYYIDFHLLSLCQHQIISNSSFGWWTAWLNQNPNKIVITPSEWIDPKWHHMTPVKDVWPNGWIQVPAAWEKPKSEL